MTNGTSNIHILSPIPLNNWNRIKVTVILFDEYRTLFYIGILENGRGQN